RRFWAGREALVGCRYVRRRFQLRSPCRHCPRQPGKRGGTARSPDGVACASAEETREGQDRREAGSIPRTLAMSDPSPQVLVVGAGPTGLLLAAELQRRDVPCLLIDALDAPLGWDRATVVHERSLEIFEALGIADHLLAEGVKTRVARFHSDGEV